MTTQQLFHLIFACILFSYSSLSLASENSTPIEDPYLWLEDSEDPNTISWLDNQKTLFDSYISTLTHRTEIKERLKEICKYDSYTIPVRSGENYFYMHKLPSEDQFSLYIQKGKDGIPEKLLDSRKLGENSLTFIQGYSISPDGNILSYGTSESGSDWINWHFCNISTNERFDDTLEKTKFTSIVWSPDSRGVFYSCYNDQDVHGLYFHVLDTLQSDDKLIYQEDPDNKNVFYTPLSSSDGRYLLLSIAQKSNGLTKFLGLDLKTGSKDSEDHFFEIISSGFSTYTYICNKGENFYFLTDHEAPLRKLVVIDINTDSSAVKELIPEGKALIDQIIPIADHFLVSINEDVNSRLAYFDSEGVWIKNLDLPDYGTIHFSSGDLNATEENAEVFFSYSNFVQPPVIYRYAVKTNSLEIFKKSSPNFDPGEFETRQIFYPGKDGTLIPMYIIHKRDLELNNSHNAMLYAYGGFNIGVFPFFSSLHLAWMEKGCVLAVANIRGGSEYGEKWHAAGMRGNKQNCFDDFISAAEWLISNGYTRPAKLAIRGMSNGGLLVAACLNQQPELFGAAHVGVGVLDMLRFHLFTVGHFWIKEYGNPNDVADFDILLRYSPVHNVKPGVKYPATLVTTGDHDDRVVPLHSYKYTAVLQEAQAGTKPVLLRVDAGAGHGFGKPLFKIIDESADVLSFFMQELQ